MRRARAARQGPTTTKALFVSHQASRTGAPMMLLHLLRWLGRTQDVDVEVLLLRGGPLEDDFRAASTGRVRVLRPDDGSSALHRIETGLEHLGLLRIGGWLRGLRYRVLLRRSRRFDVVYLNSVASFSIALYLPKRVSVVCHVHELEMGIRLATPRSLDWSRLVERVDLFVAAADCVAENLVERWHVPADRVCVHHELIDVASVRLAGAGARPLVDSTAPVVGGCGTVEWRKGADLFAQVAARVRRVRPDIQFVWVGATPSRDRWPLDHEVAALGLEGTLQVLPETDDMAAFFASLDVFALTSREDPFPLVALEASATGTPVVSFDNGGMREFLTPEIGRLVPYLDVEAMADAILELIDDDDLRRATGAAAAVAAEAYDADARAGALWHDVSSRVLDRSTAGGRPERHWWDSKVSSVLFAACAGMAAGHPDPSDTYPALVALLLSAGLLGLYAHVVDDSFDVPGDVAAGKPNSMVGLRPLKRASVAAALAVTGTAPWIFLWPGRLASSALAVILVLPVLYAAPPIRLKQRGAVGLVSDAVMAHVAPTAFAVGLLLERSSARVDDAWPLVAALVAWSLARGVRSILVHQVRDEGNDRAAASPTFVVERGAELATRIVRRIAFPLEVAGLAALAGIGATRSLLFPAFAAVYGGVWLLARRILDVPFVPAPTGHRRMALERFTIVWPPIVVAAWLASRDLAHLPLVIAPVLLFNRSISRELRALRSRARPLVHRTLARGHGMVTSDGR